jgi:hypothetical protein
MAAYALPCGLLVPGAFAAIGSAINGSLPFRANVDAGVSVGIDGVGVAVAYIWSVRATRVAAGVCVPLVTRATLVRGGRSKAPKSP